MNILIGKIGQKIIFNRDSKDCDRSNTNGNVGAYLLFKLLIENNKSDVFYVAGENDLSTFGKMPFKNVVDVSDLNYEEVNKLNIDVMFILTGLTQFEKSDRFFDIINKSNAKYILLSDDPRCLDSVSKDNRMTKIPNIIISQFEGIYDFKGVECKVKYVPIERASCYKFKPFEIEKEHDMVIVSNTSGKEYDRVKILSEIVSGIPGINIYGRLSDDEKDILGRENCKGEIKYTEMQEVFKKAYSTFMVPIKKGWVTSKYVEALMNGVLPIFHEDYGANLLECKDLIVIHDKNKFISLLSDIKANKNDFDKLRIKWFNIMIRPWIDGSKLSRILMRNAMFLLYPEGGSKYYG